MNNHPEELIQKILELKLKVYDEFLSCTQLLGKCLEKEDMKEADRLIKRREDLIKSIDKLDGKMAHLRKTPLGNQQKRMTRHIGKIFADLNEKIKLIVAANEDCRNVAAGRCVVLKEAAQVSRHEETGRMKYSANLKRPPKFLDIHS